MIEREGVLEAVGGDVPVRPEPANVVHQHVQPRIPVEHLTRQAAYLGLRGEVRGERVDRRVVRRGADVGRRRFGAIHVAAGDGYPSTQSGESNRRGLADPAGGTRDQDGLAGHHGYASLGCFGVNRCLHRISPWATEWRGLGGRPATAQAQSDHCMPRAGNP